MVIQVQAYETEDGCVYLTRTEALRHEVEIAMVQILDQTTSLDPPTLRLHIARLVDEYEDFIFQLLRYVDELDGTNLEYTLQQARDIKETVS